MNSLLEIAQAHGLAIIEDAAHALPASYQGRSIGSPAASASVPVLTCFSFYATKNLTTAEGGMLTGAPELLEEARVWSLHGMNRDAWKRYGAGNSWFYEVRCPGFKYNMTDLQAAIGLHQLAKLPRFRARRAAIAHRYNEAFSALEHFQIPAQRPEVEHAWHLYVLRLHLDRLNISRNEFIEQLAARKIAGSVHFIPMHLHAYYREKYGYPPQAFPVAYREYHRMISLPLHPGMNEQDVDDVIEAVTEIARQHNAGVPPRRGVGEVEKTAAVPGAAVAGREAREEVQELLKARPAGRSSVHRAFDTICAAAGLVILAPLFAAIAAAIKWEDGGPVLFSQARMGKDLRKFHLLKFRSMAPNAASPSALTGPEDPRITRVGRLLRKYKLDELPQLVNVVKGEMQLVGARPELEHYVDYFPAEYKVLLREAPGITDLASLTFRNEEKMFQAGPLEEQYVAQILPRKLILSLQYSQARTFFSDLEILIRTIFGLKSPVAN
jgi:lipopolysaccharide/colanic/teichoic acid biosynthesis glycosyltransferase